MSRNKNNLTARQQLFLNELVRGKQFNDILSEHRIRPATLMRWTTEKDFHKQWEICNQVLVLRRQSDECCAIRHAHSEHTTIVSQTAAAAPAASAPSLQLPPPPIPAPETKPPMTERQAIRSRHGEEAAQAFDRLCRRREQAQHTISADPPPNPTASPPESTPTPPTPTSPPELPLVIPPEVQP
jgi:hypothetical protein